MYIRKVHACGLVCLLNVTIFGDWFEVTKGTNPLTLETSGIVVSADALKFSPPATFMWNLTISQLVTEGKTVQPGELLVRFDSTRESQHLTEHQEKMAAAKTELASLVEEQKQAIESEKLALAEAKSSADKAQRKAEQPVDLLPSVDYKKLVEQKKLAMYRLAQLTRREPISAQVRFNHKQKLESKVQRLGKRLDAIQSELVRFSIHAPRAGTALIGSDFNANKFDVGERVQPSETVVELVDEDNLEVRGEMPEEYAVKLKLGQLVRMHAESTGGKEFTGRITFLGKSVRRKSRHRPEMVRDFRVTLDKQMADLQLGGSVQVVVETANVNDSIAIPQQAIKYQDGLPVVETRNGLHQVILGEQSNGKILVVEGLSEGDSVRI